MPIRRALCILCFVLVAASCSISDRWVHEDSEGVISKTFFSTVKRNKTDKSWIEANIGEPHQIVFGPNQEEIVTYHFKRTRYRTANLLLLFRFNGSVQDVEHYHLLYCNGVVKKAWWDALPNVQVARVTRWSKCRPDKVLKLMGATQNLMDESELPLSDLPLSEQPELESVQDSSILNEPLLMPEMQREGSQESQTPRQIDPNKI